MKKLSISIIICLCLGFVITPVGAQNQASVPQTTVATNIENNPPSNSTKFAITSFADTVEPLLPAVVNVYTVKYNLPPRPSDKTHLPNMNHPRAALPDNFLFEQFSEFFEQFNMPFDLRESYSNPKAISLGSGFLIDPEGYIVTNHHVVSNADEIYIKLSDNIELPAKLIGIDKRTDLALLKVDTTEALPYVKFGDASKARVGDWVIAIGNPFGLGGTVTVGIISSKGRDLDLNASGVVDDFIQTDASINTGNSGGPMFNVNGEVIGVNTAIFSPSGVNVGIGFAIPSGIVQNIVTQLKNFGKVSRGKLDVTIQEITAEIADGLGIKEKTGALVVEVMPGGSGEKAGVKSGDVIVEFAGQPVKNPRKLQVLVAETPVNNAVNIGVIRNGKKLVLSGAIIETVENQIQLSELFGKNEAKPTAPDASLYKDGITVSNITDELRGFYSLKEEVSGVLITDIEKTSTRYGFNFGDVIISANQDGVVKAINNINDFDKVYNDAQTARKKSILLLVKRHNASIFIPFPVEATKVLEDKK